VKRTATAEFRGAGALFADAIALTPLQLDNANLRAENILLRERVRLQDEDEAADFDSVKNAATDLKMPRSTIERLMNLAKIEFRWDKHRKHREPSKRDLRRRKSRR
jgi:hypothetical protein